MMIFFIIILLLIMSKFAYACHQMRVAAIIRLYEYCIICILNSHRFYIIHKLKIIKSLFINEEQPFVAFCVNHYLIYFGDMYIYKFIMNAKNYLKIRYLKKKKQQQQQQKLTHYEVWPASCMVAYV